MDGLMNEAGFYQPGAGARGSSPRSKFLLISNMRSGSTWVETTLGSLPDVAVDHEMKWGAAYDPAPVHIMVDRHEQTVSELLDGIEPRLPVAGSKLTFDPAEMPRREFQRLVDRIGRDVRIVHLTRDYRSVFLSIVRGVAHSINPDRVQALGAGLRKGLVERRAPRRPRREVSPDDCAQLLASLLANDRNVRSLAARGFAYLQVEYRSFARQFASISAFVGSRATREEVRQALANPVVNKLPRVSSGRVVTNIGELEPIFTAFEKQRRSDIWLPETRPFARLWA